MGNDFDKVDNYLELTDQEKLSLFEKMYVLRGFSFTPEAGFKRSFDDLYHWADGYLPAHLRPIQNTMQRNYHTVSKMEHELNKMNVNSASLSFTSRFFSADAKYEQETDKKTSTSVTKEYLLALHMIRKCSFRINFECLQVNEEFVRAIASAVNTKENISTRALALLMVLNEWGYYVPQEFSLGGILFSETEIEVKDSSTAEKDRKDFSASFKTSFMGIGGGGGYSGSWGTEKHDSTSNKFENTTIYQIGGAEGITNDFSYWATSLYDARLWNIVECEKLYPTLMLLKHVADKSYGNDLLGNCMRIITSCLSVPAVYKLQPYINLGSYVAKMEEMLNPFWD